MSVRSFIESRVTFPGVPYLPDCRRGQPGAFSRELTGGDQHAHAARLRLAARNGLAKASVKHCFE
jgi:hypothetical protein